MEKYKEVVAEIKWRLVKFCKENKISHDKIAVAFDVKRQSVSEWFNVKGNTMPPLLAVYWLVKNAGLDANSLFSNERNEESPVGKNEDLKADESEIIVAVRELAGQVEKIANLLAKENKNL